MSRTHTSWISSALALAVGSVVAQGYYAGHRPLPHFADLDPSAEFGPRTGTRIRIVGLGDSTLTGPGLIDPTETWIHQVLRRVDGPTHITFRSFASGGAKLRDVRRHQLRSAVDFGPDIAIVAAGSNDAIRAIPPRLVRSELAVIARTLAESGAAVLLAGVGDLGVIPRLPDPLARLLTHRSASADRIQRRVALGMPNVVKAPMREIATEPFRTLPDLFSPDLFHPNVRGHGIWADAVGPTLTRMIDITAERKRTCDD